MTEEKKTQDQMDQKQNEAADPPEGKERTVKSDNTCFMTPQGIPSTSGD